MAHYLDVAVRDLDVVVLVAAAEILHRGALSSEHGVTAEALKDGVYAYPTFSSDIKFLA